MEEVVINESRKATGYAMGCRQRREVHILSGLVCSVTNLLYLEDDAVTDCPRDNSTSLQAPLICKYGCPILYIYNFERKLCK